MPHSYGALTWSLGSGGSPVSSPRHAGGASIVAFVTHGKFVCVGLVR